MQNKCAARETTSSLPLFFLPTFFLTNVSDYCLFYFSGKKTEKKKLFLRNKKYVTQ
jgi:hypothetical protein